MAAVWLWVNAMCPIRIYNCLGASSEGWVCHGQTASCHQLLQTLWLGVLPCLHNHSHCQGTLCGSACRISSVRTRVGLPFRPCIWRRYSSHFLVWILSKAKSATSGHSFLLSSCSQTRLPRTKQDNGTWWTTMQCHRETDTLPTQDVPQYRNIFYTYVVSSNLAVHTVATPYKK